MSFIHLKLLPENFLLLHKNWLKLIVVCKIQAFRNWCQNELESVIAYRLVEGKKKKKRQDKTTRPHTKLLKTKNLPISTVAMHCLSLGSCETLEYVQLRVREAQQQDIWKAHNWILVVWFISSASCLQCDEIVAVALLMFLCVKKVSKYFNAQRFEAYTIKVRVESFSSSTSEREN